MPAKQERGRFVWYDLTTKDPAAAADFYTKLIGWSTQPWEGSMPYTMWVNGETPLGGVVQQPDDAGAPPHWMSYIATPDVDATAEQAKELGGSVVHGPEDIPSVGRFAVISDPQGAMFAAFTSATDSPEREGPAQLGEVSWHELATTDHEAAFEFYRSLFGWETKETMDMGEMGTYHMYGTSGEKAPLGGMFNKPPEMPAPGWLYYIKVKDVNGAVETVKELGGKVLNGPMEVPGGSGDMIAQCVDPQGAAFALHSAAQS
ncbi:MAG: VOC family protein [Gemmatimonadota bacterium]